MLSVKVNGGLGFLLKCSRILGVSFVSFTPATDGYIVTFSDTTAIYSYCCVTLCSILVVIALLINIKLNDNLPSGKILDSILYITFSILITFNGKSRTKSMIEHLTSLNKIKEEISGWSHNSPSQERRHLVFCLTSFVFWIILYVLFIIRSILIAKITADYIYLTIIYHSLQMSLLETLILMLKLSVYNAFKILSGELRTQLNIVKSDSNINIDDIEVMARDSTKINIPTRVNALVSICKVIKEINETNGGNMLYLIFITIVYIIFVIGDMIVALRKNDDLFSIIYVIFWIFMLLFRFYVIIDPCYYISKEATEIQVLLSKLMCHSTAVGKPCSWEWDLIFKQLYLLEPTLTPLGMFTLNRSFVTSIISVVTTYITIVIPHIHTIYEFIRLQ